MALSLFGGAGLGAAGATIGGAAGAGCRGSTAFIFLVVRRTGRFDGRGGSGVGGVECGAGSGGSD